jgi:Cdc6-like AAA superfamily ATPase
MKRKYKYAIILISFMWWMKTNKPEKYNQLEEQLKNVRMPLSVILDLMDAMLYYKSELRALKVFLKYFQNREEIIMNQRVSDLAQWARTWRSN